MIALPDLKFTQDSRGLAVGTDALALLRRVTLRPGLRILDLGTGQGTMALMIAAMAEVDVVGLERNANALVAARKNRLLNSDQLKGNVRLVRADLRTLPWTSGQFDMVVMNPPYFRLGEGRLSPDPERAEARHEIHGTLKDWIAAAKRSIKRGGDCWCLQIRERAEETMFEMNAQGFTPAKENHDESTTPFVILHAQLAR